MQPALDYSAFAKTLTAIYCREGYPFAGKEDYVLPKIEWELASGQWVMLTAKGSDQLYGWMSYYLVDDETLELLRSGEIEEYVVNGIPVDLLNGQHIYIATTITTPTAPAGTYRRLFELIQAKEPSAKTISAHLNKRSGAVRWLHRSLEKGE